MYRISELASLVGLSRTALLYYERRGLLSSRRSDNGYRLYDDSHVQQLRLIQHLQNGGLTLAECYACLHKKIDTELLNARYAALEQEIAAKQASLALLAGLAGKGDSQQWHKTLSSIAPDAHVDWLQTQGYDEKQALRIKWLSKDMNDHDNYMNDFLRIFEPLEFWGPGSEDDTSKAFAHIPIDSPKRILDIGCGKGNATMTLAALSSAQIDAVDNEQSALDNLNHKIAANKLTERIASHCASMTKLDFDAQSFDLIWAEASMYVMGVNNALRAWRQLLTNRGVLVFSDLVWLTDDKSAEVVEFWQHEYPDMHNIEQRIALIHQNGFNVSHTFTLSHCAWSQYYEPLRSRIESLKTSMPNSQALRDIEREVSLYERYLGEFGYQFFIAQRTD